MLARHASRLLGKQLQWGQLGSVPAVLRRPHPLQPQKSSRALRAGGIVMMGRRSEKIAGRKGKSDQAKSKLFGKFGKLIVQAVQAGGPDAVANSRLRDLLVQARANNVPKDIIDRNIKRAAEKGQANFSEVLYEAYGPGGTGFVIEALTDNLNRTAAEVRTAVGKSGGKMADAGSVLFNFQRQGILTVNGSEDEVFEAAMDVGAEDVQAVSADVFRVSTTAEDFMRVYRALQEQDMPVTNGSLQYVALAATQLDDELLDANESMHEALLELDDVDAVFSTCSLHTEGADE